MLDIWVGHVPRPSVTEFLFILLPWRSHSRGEIGLLYSTTTEALAGGGFSMFRLYIPYC